MIDTVSPRNAGRVPLGLVAALALCACASVPEGEAIVLHGAFGSAAGVLVEGRVAEAALPIEPNVADTPRLNLRRNTALFVIDSCERCKVEIALEASTPVEARTDDRGFFRTEIVPAAGVADGWRPLVATGEGITRAGRALIVPPGNRLGIVSDIDDTVLVTEVTDRFRMLGNTFLKNPLQREAVPGVARLYRRVLKDNPRPGAAPLFYLSSSPRELQGYLAAFLAGNDFPRGVLLTRRLTFDATGYAKLDPIAYKGARLDEILGRLPDVNFVLVGDDGEHDPEIYDAVRRRHPGRILAIWIRRVTPGEPAALPAGQVELADVLAGGVAVPALADAPRREGRGSRTSTREAGQARSRGAGRRPVATAGDGASFAGPASTHRRAAVNRSRQRPGSMIPQAKRDPPAQPGVAPSGQ